MTTRTERWAQLLSGVRAYRRVEPAANLSALKRLALLAEALSADGNPYELIEELEAQLVALTGDISDGSDDRTRPARGRRPAPRRPGAA